MRRLKSQPDWPDLCQRRPATAGAAAAGFACLCAALLAGCAGSAPSLKQFQAINAATTPLETAALQAPIKPSATKTGAEQSADHSGKPAAVYSRIARGVRRCWLAPGRPLAKTHKFHAEVTPESKGSKAVIVLYQLGPDTDVKAQFLASLESRSDKKTDQKQARNRKISRKAKAKKPHNAKPPPRRAALRVVITPSSTAMSKVSVISRRFAPELSRPMSDAIFRWAAGRDDCPVARTLKSATAAILSPALTQTVPASGAAAAAATLKAAKPAKIATPKGKK